MNQVGQKVYDILRSELSDITSKSLLERKCKDIGKNPDTLTFEDVRNIGSKLLAGVLLFGGEEKAKAIKEKLKKLSQSLF